LEKTPSAKRSKKKAQPVAETSPRAPEAKDEYLLVSKSWYVQGGNQNRQEAVRVSKVLKEFRWKVEPVYTIGVMLDDLLSIETSKNEITRPLIERIEGAGYRLTAVVVEQGKPVAWFKRNQEDPPRRGERAAGGARHLWDPRPHAAGGGRAGHDLGCESCPSRPKA
jgi:hypothetical protein